MNNDAPFFPEHQHPCPTGDDTPISLRADFSERALVLPEDYHWTASPAAGITRMMLDRVGNEVARATSIVHYAPNSEFPAHLHQGGEEFYVLAGEFADEHGQYPAGTYMRNPVGTSHAPRVGPKGATLFVKLHQFSTTDTQAVNIFTPSAEWAPGLVLGLSVLSLHNHEHEHVALVKWAPKTQFRGHKHWSGEEILVLEGTFYDEHGVYPRGSWLRSPHLSEHTPYTQEDGALIYVKTGHLPPQVNG